MKCPEPNRAQAVAFAIGTGLGSIVIKSLRSVSVLTAMAAATPIGLAAAFAVSARQNLCVSKKRLQDLSTIIIGGSITLAEVQRAIAEAMKQSEGQQVAFVVDSKELVWASRREAKVDQQYRRECERVLAQAENMASVRRQRGLPTPQEYIKFWQSLSLITQFKGRTVTFGSQHLQVDTISFPGGECEFRHDVPWLIINGQGLNTQEIKEAIFGPAIVRKNLNNSASD